MVHRLNRIPNQAIPKYPITADEQCCHQPANHLPPPLPSLPPRSPRTGKLQRPLSYSSEPPLDLLPMAVVNIIIDIGDGGHAHPVNEGR